MMPARFPWMPNFPQVWIHSNESDVKHHEFYGAAKAGDVGAAIQLVYDTMSDGVLEQLVEFCREQNPVLVSVHAEEAVGVNAIPEVLADGLAYILAWDLEQEVVQSNVVNHTGADGFTRLARQALFEGSIDPGRNYLIVDDFIGQGGTIANLRGHIMQQGGVVIGATVLTGKPYSAILELTEGRLSELRAKHGHLEEWWKERFGFGFDSLTASEARYLINTAESETIRDRIEGAHC